MLVPLDCPDKFDPEDDIVLRRFSPGGTRLIVATRDDDWAVVLDARAGRQIARFTDLKSLIGALFLSEDRLLLFEVDGKGSSVVDLAGREVKWEGEKIPGFNAWTGPNPNLIISGCGSLYLYDLAEQKCILRFVSGCDGGATCAACSPDGRYLAADSYSDRNFRFLNVWDLRSGTLLRVNEIHPMGQNGAVLAISPDNRLLAMSVGRGVRLYGLEDAEPIAHHDPGPGITASLRFSPSGRSLELVSFQGEMARIDPESGRVLKHVPGPQGHELFACAVSAQGLAAGVAAKAVVFWRLPDWEESSQVT
jgi:WD40 repeat protein